MVGSQQEAPQLFYDFRLEDRERQTFLTLSVRLEKFGADGIIPPGRCLTYNPFCIVVMQKNSRGH